jgi:hypothetical protein
MDTEMTTYGNYVTKALNICGYWLTETVYNPETFASAKYYVYDRIFTAIGPLRH